MILQTFDIGWDSNLETKKFEQEILSPLLTMLSNSEKKVVVINSTWYTNDYHNIVLDYLHSITVDYIILISLLDFAIPTDAWFKKIPAEVIKIGYYLGKGEIDYWALFLDQYFTSQSTIESVHVDQPFMCLNRKPHEHRIRLYQQLQQHNLNTCGLVSMGSTDGVAIQSLDSDTSFSILAPNSDLNHYGIPNDIATLGNLKNWNRSFLSIITETVYNINQQHFVSEKIYKPILGMRPFLVYATDCGYKWLNDRGFEPYHYDFADISDLDLTVPDNIVPFLAILCQQGSGYWQ